MSSLTRSSYTLSAPSRTCAATGRTLATGEPVVAALIQAGDPGNEHFARVDFSMEAWKAGSRPTDAAGKRFPVLGSWRGLVPEPGAKKRILVDDESLLDMFDQSGEQPLEESGGSRERGSSTAPDRRTFRFMLALILLRKRLLICEKTDASGTMFVRPRGSPKSTEGGVLSEVEDPRLGAAAAAAIAGQLSALLDGEMTQTGAPSVEVKP